MSNQQLPGEDEKRKDKPEETQIYFTENSTLQTPEEYELDKHGDHTEESQTVATPVEDYESGNEGMEGSETTGDSE